jgi:hypothetical protein
MNLSCADSLMAIFGFRRVSTNETERTALYEEHRDLVERKFLGTATQESEARLGKVRAELDNIHMMDACPGEWSLEDRVSE